MPVIPKKNISLEEQIKKIPALPGVYFFKDDDGHILYIGKAKNLKKRTQSYIQHQQDDAKVHAIFEQATNITYQTTTTELEAMLLEAKLIQSNKPKFNVIFTLGQPFVYLLFTHDNIPTLHIVRNQKKKGFYIGPFLEKGAARTVYNFLIKTFALKLCNKKIENGCLDYHLGICAGMCRKDFDKNAYLERLSLAKKILTKDHETFLNDLMQEIQKESALEHFERAQELLQYYHACQKMFAYHHIKPQSLGSRIGHDIWIIDQQNHALHMCIEQHNVITKKQTFYYPFTEKQMMSEHVKEFIESFYRLVRPSFRILINEPFDQETIDLLEAFLRTWHKLEHNVTILTPQRGHEAALVRYALAITQQDMLRQATLGKALKKLLLLSKEPVTIDCFDISHKQGTDMVGSCIRFTNGKPDKKNFRHFHIKTINQQNDYASLMEIVQRRYKNPQEFPDLVLIDGGKGQLSSVSPLIPPSVELASLAKREEIIYSAKIPEGRKLNIHSFVGQMLIALRDYTHHFAITFHQQTARKQLQNQ